MRTKTEFTKALRLAAAWAWSLGLAVIAFDFLSLPVFEWRASASYLCFGLATVLVAWAEKREFSTRIFLYRLHDSVIYSPWKYLLLYFLWISLFSPFTESPRASLVYAANGWMSLFAVGISAQFIFCERAGQGAVLLPSRLRIAFFAYALTAVLLMGNTLLHLFKPAALWPIPPNEQANLFLYFLLGLPFLLWDFIKDGRRLLPRWLSLIAIWAGTVTILLIGRLFYHFTLGAILSGVLGAFFYKKIRARRALALGMGAAAASVFLSLALGFSLERLGLKADTLSRARLALESRMRGTIEPAWEELLASNFMGRGIGVTEVPGVWPQVAAEAGIVGLALYGAFFLALLWELYRVRRSTRVVVSNISALSVLVFVALISHHIGNPYSAYSWVWYALWALFASTPKKRHS